MVRASTMTRLKGDVTLLGIVTYATFLIAVAMVAGGIWLASRGATTSGCVGSLHMAILVVGLVLMMASIVGFAATCSRQAVILRMYLVLLFLIVLAVLGVVIFAFAFAVTSHGGDGGEVVVERSFPEYQLSAFHGTLRSNFDEPAYWKKVTAYLRKAPACAAMTRLARDTDGNLVLVDGTPRISPVEGGCCFPPSSCAFAYSNGSWTRAPDGAAFTNEDCSKWGNGEEQLCFDCDTCKAGVLAGAKKTWRRVSVLNSVLVGLLTVAFVVGTCAFRRVAPVGEE